MEGYIQGAAAVLIGVILTLTLGKQGKDMAVLLSIGVCMMVLLLAGTYLSPVLEFLRELEQIGKLNGEMIGCLFKVVGIGMVTEISAMVCADSGNGSLGKALQLLGAAVILWLSIPVFRALLSLIQGILGDV